MLKHVLAGFGLLLALAFAAPAPLSAAIYDVREWSDGAGGSKAGVYAITDAATLSAFSSVLTPYVAADLPMQGVLAGDDPASPSFTTELHFPDWTTARNVEAQVNGPVVRAPPALPAEVALYRVKVVLKQTASTHGGTLYDRVPTFIATLPADQQVIASIMWTDAPNLEVGGSFAQGFKAWEGISDSAWNALIGAAQNLPL